MKFGRLAFLTFALLTTSQVFAQAPADPPAAAGPPPSGSPSDEPPPAPGSPAAQGGVKALRATCRTEAKGQGLSGEALHAAVSACVVRARPDLADKEKCRTEGRAQGLHKEGLRSFVKDCVKGKA